MDDLKTINSALLDKQIRWALGDPRHKSHRQLKRDGMYRQFTMDIRVDFTDEDKLAMVREAVAACGRQVFATVSLIADGGSKPQIAIYSDDSFAGHEDISILENTVQKGHEELAAVGAGDTAPVEEGLSQEMLDACAGVKWSDA